MNEEKIDELKNALRQIIELVTQRQKPLSQELKAVIAQAMEHVASRIQQLRQEGEEPLIGQKEPELNNQYPSSNVHSFGYDPKSNRLLVKFQGDYPQENGDTYAYSGVPPVIFDLFRKGAVPARTNGQNKWGKWWKGKNPSLGASLYTLIKGGNYPYQKLS